MKTWNSEYFYGNKISEYGLENKRVDYATLAKSFESVLNNNIMSMTEDIGYWEQETGGTDYDELEELEEQLEELEEQLETLLNKMCELEEWGREETAEYKETDKKHTETENKIQELEEQIDELNNYYPEIFQYFIVDDNGANILEEFGEIVFYNSALDMYIWGVTHWGTAWDYVLTDIKIEL